MRRTEPERGRKLERRAAVVDRAGRRCRRDPGGRPASRRSAPSTGPSSRMSSRAGSSPGLTATTKCDAPSPRSKATAGPAAPATRSGPSRSPRSARRRCRSARTESRRPGSQRPSSHGNARAAIRVVAARQPDLVAVVDRTARRGASPGGASPGSARRASPPRTVRSRGASCEPSEVELDRDDVRVVGVRELDHPCPRTPARRAAGPTAGTRDGVRDDRHVEVVSRRRSPGSPRPAGSSSARRSGRRAASRARPARSRRPGRRPG